jgi:hypothetical protein
VEILERVEEEATVTGALSINSFQGEHMQIEQFTIYWAIFGPDSPILMPLPKGKMRYYELTENTSFPVYISV